MLAAAVKISSSFSSSPTTSDHHLLPVLAPTRGPYVFEPSPAKRNTTLDCTHYEIYGPESDAPRKLVLVNQASSRRLVLEHADDLARGKAVPLALASHPGMAIVKRYQDVFPARGGGSKVFLGVGPTCVLAGDDGVAASGTHEPLIVELKQGKFIVSITDGSVLDVGRNYRQSDLILVSDPAKEKSRKPASSPTEFKVNADGTISTMRSKGVMVLGVGK